MNRIEFLKQKVSQTPSKPGVYFWKNKNNEIIYIGKANNLNRRLNDYLQGSLNSYKSYKMLQEIVDFDFELCLSEKEAFVLEQQRIKEHKPPYNILLLDDKKYPYLSIKPIANKLIIQETREYKNLKNTFYFGPFPPNYGLKPLKKMLERITSYEQGLLVERSDWNYWNEKYQMVKEILSFKNKNFINSLIKQRDEASMNLQFEIARELRDCVFALEKMHENQMIEIQKISNLDVLAYKFDKNFLYITTLFYRQGILLRQDNNIVEITLDIKETLENFIDHFYKINQLPKQLIVSDEFINLQIENNYDFEIFNPKRGINKSLLERASQINLEFYENEKNKQSLKMQNHTEIENELYNVLKIKNITNIAIFDNSHFNNLDPVGVVVYFTNFKRNNSLSRKFNLTVEDEYRKADVEYMRQSFNKFINLKITKPDLIIMDGGLAQIHEVKKILKTNNLYFPIIGLVKNDKHTTDHLIDLDENTIEITNKKLYNFFAKIQEEVDIYAKSKMRDKRKKHTFESKLLSIKGIGPKTEKLLIKHFKSYTNIYNATFEELSKVVNKDIAQNIINFVNNKDLK